MSLLAIACGATESGVVLDLAGAALVFLSSAPLPGVAALATFAIAWHQNLQIAIDTTIMMSFIYCLVERTRGSIEIGPRYEILRRRRQKD